MVHESARLIFAISLRRRDDDKQLGMLSRPSPLPRLQNIRAMQVLPNPSVSDCLARKHFTTTHGLVRLNTTTSTRHTLLPPELFDIFSSLTNKWRAQCP